MTPPPFLKELLFHDLEPEYSSFYEDIIIGLSKKTAKHPAKVFL